MNPFHLWRLFSFSATTSMQPIFPCKPSLVLQFLCSLSLPSKVALPLSYSLVQFESLVSGFTRVLKRLNDVGYGR